MNYTMKEVSEKFGIATSAIRYYDHEGLLPFLERSNGGIRYFTETDVEWLEFVMMLKDTGMCIKDIKTYINSLYNDDNVNECLKIFRNHLEKMNSQMNLIQKSITKINYTIWELEKKEVK